MTTRAWRWLLGSLLGLNLASAVLGRETICSTLREVFHVDEPEGRRRLVVVTAEVIAWWLPHMLNPAKRPAPRRD
jgi:hypothetical protein